MLNKSENILDVIKKLADINFQKDVWALGKYWDRITDFTEAINTLEDYNFVDDLTLNRIGLSEIELKEVKLFVDKLFNYDYKTTEIMISDKHWEEIVDDAKRVNEILKKYYW